MSNAQTPTRWTPWIIAFAMVFPFFLTLVYFVILASWPGLVHKSAYAIGKAIQFGLPLFWVAWMLKEPWFIRPWNSRGVGLGIAFGIVVFAAMIILYTQWFCLPGAPLGEGSYAKTAILNKVKTIGFLDPRLFILLGIFYSVIHSGLEEYYWRWFVFGQLRKLVPLGWAIVVSSLGFMAHHVLLVGTYFGYDSPYCWLCSIGVAVGGMVWAWLYHRSDSIWGPWISHGIIDTAIFAVGYCLIFKPF